MLELHDTLLSLWVAFSPSPAHTNAAPALAVKRPLVFLAPLPFALPSPSASIQSIFTSNERSY